MIMLIQSICIALRGLGSPRRVERVMRDRAAMLLQGGGARGTGKERKLWGLVYCQW